MTALLLDMCVDQRHVAPAFLALAEGAFITDWIEADAADERVLELARQLNRILVTEDADFGELIYRDRMLPPAGIILAMTPLIPRDARAAWIERLAAPALKVAGGNFVVIGPTHYRYRAFPD